MRTPVAVVSIAALLAGCASVADEAARAQRDADRMIQVYGPACEKLGYQNNTDPWRNCILGMSAKDDMARYSSSYYGPAFYPRWGWGPYWGY